MGPPDFLSSFQAQPVRFIVTQNRSPHPFQTGKRALSCLESKLHALLILKVY
jgi:hypothetical protein